MEVKAREGVEEERWSRYWIDEWNALRLSHVNQHFKHRRRIWLYIGSIN